MTTEAYVIEALLGQVLVKAEKIDARTGWGENDQLVFWLADGRAYMFSHHQQCCEEVCIESIVGDLEDLVGSPLLMAEEVCNEEKSGKYDDSATWTFYKFATLKGYVDVRWVGSSNGYYSESVDHGFLEIDVQKRLSSS